MGKGTEWMLVNKECVLRLLDLLYFLLEETVGLTEDSCSFTIQHQ